MERPDILLNELAERQHGVIARRQAMGLGLSRGAWLYRMDGVRWEPVTEHVARRAGTPRTELQRAMAAVLDAGPHGYLSHDSAAALWGHPAFRVDPVEVIVTRHRSRRTQGSDLAVIHHPRHLPDPFATTLQGVPVVRPALVLLQLAPRVHPERLRRILDWFWNRRLLSGPSVRVELDPLLGQGRAGTRSMRALLDSLPADYVPPASNLEARVARIIADHDLPPMRRQVDLGGTNWSGRVDFVAKGMPLILEVDSEMYHSALTDVEADEKREAHLEADGFAIVRVDEYMVWHRPEGVATRVRAAISRLRQLRSAA